MKLNGGLLYRKDHLFVRLLIFKMEFTLIMSIYLVYISWYFHTYGICGSVYVCVYIYCTHMYSIQTQCSDHFIRYLLLIFCTILSSVAVAHPRKGSMCWVFRAAILHTSVISTWFLNYCHLPVSLNQSGHSTLSSLSH